MEYFQILKITKLLKFPKLLTYALLTHIFFSHQKHFIGDIKVYAKNNWCTKDPMSFDSLFKQTLNAHYPGKDRSYLSHIGIYHGLANRAYTAQMRGPLDSKAEIEEELEISYHESADSVIKTQFQYIHEGYKFYFAPRFLKFLGEWGFLSFLSFWESAMGHSVP